MGPTVRRVYPDFLIIGAQKAGTTWLHRNLRAHPRVWMPDVKEIHYFDEKVHQKGGPLRRLGSLRGDRPEDIRWRRQVKAQLKRYPKRPPSPGHVRWDLNYFLGRYSDAWYASLFRPGEGRIAGEATPDYSILDRGEISHVHTLMPDARILLMVRSPLERAWSATAMTFRLLGRRMEAMTDDELGSWLASRRVRLLTDYLKTLDAWGEFYPPERIFVGFLEDVHFQPDALMRRVYAFLGADEGAKYRVIRQKVHSGSNERMPTRSAVYLARAYREELGRLDRRFGGYANFWLYCAERLIADPPAGETVPYPLWESPLWEDWAEGPGSYVKTVPGRPWLQSGPLSEVAKGHA